MCKGYHPYSFVNIRYLKLGKKEKAVGIYEQGLAVSRDIGHRKGEGSHLGNMGIGYCILGQVEKAISYLKQSLSIFEEIKSPYAETVRNWLEELERGE